MATTKPEVKINCVGCQHRNDKAMLMVNDPEWDQHMTLVKEPTNEFDPNAIAVQYKGNTVGYVARDKQQTARKLFGCELKWGLSAVKFVDEEHTVLKWVEFLVTIL